MDRTNDPQSLETLAALAAACEGGPPALELGGSLTLEETLATIDEKLRQLVRYDSLIFHVPLRDSIPPDDAAASAARSLAPVLRPQCLALPLLHGGEFAGVIEFHLEAGMFSEQDLRFLLAIRRKLTAAVWNARNYDSAIVPSAEAGLLPKPLPG